ncbi:MAG: excalibur calcium-binding domain-containing protein [Citromicrobium sp.]|nr:excalibur calcium-binding domain-containing protein [Citromicrobium sp.]
MLGCGLSVRTVRLCYPPPFESNRKKMDGDSDGVACGSYR